MAFISDFQQYKQSLIDERGVWQWHRIDIDEFGKQLETAPAGEVGRLIKEMIKQLCEKHELRRLKTQNPEFFAFIQYAAANYERIAASLPGGEG